MSVDRFFFLPRIHTFSIRDTHPPRQLTR
jgi:hypothetical protein